MQELDISNNSITSLPDELGEMKQMTKLNISGSYFLRHFWFIFPLGNKLSTIPRTIGNLNLLVTLDAKSNEISELPAGIGFSFFPSLISF